MASFQPTFRMLTIDGGGIRGIIPAMVLTEIEKRTNKPIYELFDLIAGTSTGGILASGLTMPADNQQGAKYTAAQMVNIYDNFGGEIFSKSGWRKWLGKMDEFFGSRFDAQSLEGLLLRYFGEARLKDSLTEIVVNITVCNAVCRLILIPALRKHNRKTIFYSAIFAEPLPQVRLILHLKNYLLIPTCRLSLLTVAFMPITQALLLIQKLKNYAITII
jgi:patatin-like phospholipase/acyl hydrolase